MKSFILIVATAAMVFSGLARASTCRHSLEDSYNPARLISILKQRGPYLGMRRSQISSAIAPLVLGNELTTEHQRLFKEHLLIKIRKAKEAVENSHRSEIRSVLDTLQGEVDRLEKVSSDLRRAKDRETQPITDRIQAINDKLRGIIDFRKNPNEFKGIPLSYLEITDDKRVVPSDFSRRDLRRKVESNTKNRPIAGFIPRALSKSDWFLNKMRFLKLKNLAKEKEVSIEFVFEQVLLREKLVAERDKVNNRIDEESPQDNGQRLVEARQALDKFKQDNQIYLIENHYWIDGEKTETRLFTDILAQLDIDNLPFQTVAGYAAWIISSLEDSVGEPGESLYTLILSSSGDHDLDFDQVLANLFLAELRVFDYEAFLRVSNELATDKCESCDPELLVIISNGLSNIGEFSPEQVDSIVKVVELMGDGDENMAAVIAALRDLTSRQSE